VKGGRMRLLFDFRCLPLMFAGILALGALAATLA
jgi:hypothetical protein